MVDNAQHEHIDEKESLNEPNSEDRGSCLSVESDGGNIDIVAIHDIGGHQRKTWTKDDDTEACWLPEVYDDARIMLYGYDTSATTSNVYTRQGVYNEANRLLSSLRIRRQGVVENEKRSIVFICHGIGGLIVKAAFVIASRSAPIYDEMVFATRALIFIDYIASHNPESMLVTQDRLTKYLPQIKTSFVPGVQFQLLSSLSESLHEVENLFIHSKTRSHAFFFNIPSKTDHSISGNSSLDSSAPALPLKPYAFVEELKAARSEDWLYGKLEAHHVETLQWLSSQVSPFLPSTSLRGPDTTPILEDFLSTRKGCLVHIRSDANAIRSAEFVSQYLRTHSSEHIDIFRFDFNPHDIRFNNITAMLRTWLSQLAFRGMKPRNWPTQKMLEYMKALQVWGGKDLILFWFRFLNYRDIRNTIFVIGGLDQCDSSREYFLSFLKKVFTETEAKLRIIVTTTEGLDDETGDKWLGSMPTEVCQELQLDSSNTPTGSQEDIPVRLAILFQQHPRYIGTELEHLIGEILASGLDDELSRVVMTWLACDHIPLDRIRHHVASLNPPTPELIFECILSEIPMERRNWARQLLFWVLQSVRAVRTEEFWAMSQNILNDPSTDSKQSLLGWFAGLLRIEYDEVQLGHPHLRSWLDNGHVRFESCAWWRYESLGQGHFDILKNCLHYLRNPAKHVYRLIPPGLHGFLYAVQYWHVHYQAVHDEHAALVDSAIQLALEFLEDTAAFQSWIEAYMRTTDPFTAPDPLSKRPLPIASHLGLYNLVRILETKHPEDLMDALIEAAKKGHLQIVRHLVTLSPKHLSLEEPKLGKLIKAAASCGNDEIVDEILTLIPRQNLDSEQKPAWISDMLLKACWLGHEPLVDVLLDLGADPQTTMQYSSGAIRPLHLAIQTNKPGVIKLFQEKHTRLCLDDPVLPDILSTWASQEVTELLLANGFKADTKAESGWTAFHSTCGQGRPNIADLLVTRRPDLVNSAGSDLAPVFLCSVHENIRTMKVMLEHGADVHTFPSDADGNALFYAVQNDRLDICQLLLEHKIDVNYKVEGNKPPIIAAFSCSLKNRFKIIRLLLDHGADPEIVEGIGPRMWGRTALLVACALGSSDAPEIVKSLLDRSVATNVRDSEGWTPIFTAACFGRVNSMMLLIDAKADMYATCGDQKWNALQAASAFDEPEAARLLLDKGMDPFEKYEAFSSALQLCARTNKPELLKAMLELSGEQKEMAMSLALLDAVLSSSSEAVRLLLDEGSGVDHIHDKRTLISFALETGKEDIIRMLLEFRPNLDHEELGDKTLLHFIRTETTVPSLKLLINAGARIDGLDKNKDSPLTYAVGCGNIDAVKYLLTKPAARLTINICASEGTPLHQACIYSSPQMVRLLIENGADPDQRDEMGRKPVHIACSKSLGLLDALNLSDQDFTIKDKLGCVPLHLCVFSDELELVKNVLERSKVAGLDINIRDNDGWTLLLWAARMIHFDKVIDFILDSGADLGARGHVHHDFNKMGDQQWSASDVAAYHGLFDLADRLENAVPGTFRNRFTSLGQKSGKDEPKVYCKGCTLSCLGPYATCEECTSFILCFKCYNSREALHPNHHFEIKLGERDDGEDNLPTKAAEVPSSVKDLHEEYRIEEILDDEIVSNDED